MRLYAIRSPASCRNYRSWSARTSWRSMQRDSEHLSCMAFGREVCQPPLVFTITSGNEAKISGIDWTVPKALLVGELRLALGRGRVRVAQGLSERETLAHELVESQARLSKSGRASFEASSGASDDTVLSLSLGVYCAKNQPTPATQHHLMAFLRGGKLDQSPFRLTVP
jgi:hypothetical protein